MDQSEFFNTQKQRKNRLPSVRVSLDGWMDDGRDTRKNCSVTLSVTRRKNKYRYDNITLHLIILSTNTTTQHITQVGICIRHVSGDDDHIDILWY
jgi:hypothetical protein